MHNMHGTIKKVFFNKDLVQYCHAKHINEEESIFGWSGVTEKSTLQYI